MITIPITIIAAFFGITLLGVLVGAVITVLFFFGCDEKRVKKNIIFSVITVWVCLIIRLLTDAGVIIWK